MFFVANRSVVTSSCLTSQSTDLGVPLADDEGSTELDGGGSNTVSEFHSGGMLARGVLEEELHTDSAHTTPVNTHQRGRDDR